MNGRPRLGLAGLAFLGALLLPLPTRAQLVIGQYEDEAPLGSWNRLGPVSGSSLACGGVRIAAAGDFSAAFVNPSLLPGLPRFTASAGGTLLSASLGKYAVYNTGVLGAASHPFQNVYALEFGGLAFRTGGWAFAAGSGVLESYDRPELRYDYTERGVRYYGIDFRQSGWLKVINVAAARRLSRRLAVGLGLNAVTGRIERNLVEEYPVDGTSFLDRRKQNIRGFFANAGLTWAFSDRFSASAAVRTPCVRKADGSSLLEYGVPAAGTDIRIEAKASDEYRHPWIAGGGIAWRAAKNLRVAADAVWFGWSSYRMTYFGEGKPRRFRDILTFGAGMEYTGTLRLLGREVRAPLRAGVMVDPQPMVSPRSTYYAATFGGGLVLGRIRLDLAGALGRERGSGDSLAVRRAAVTLTYAIGD